MFFIIPERSAVDANASLQEPTEAVSTQTTPNTRKNENLGSVGIIVVSGGKILTGTRHNDTGYGLICGPGGHIEEGETPEQAAVRETQEEFGIAPQGLIEIGLGPKEPDTDLTPHIFLCTDYDGEVKCDDLEMVVPKFRTMQELEELKPSLFQPFADDIELLKRLFGPHNGGGESSERHDGMDAKTSLTEAMQKTTALRRKLHEQPRNCLSNGGKSAIIKVETNNTDGESDAKPEGWITLPNGVHVPLGSNGEATGGPVKGENFSEAKTEATGSVKESEQNEKNEGESTEPDKPKTYPEGQGPTESCKDFVSEEKLEDHYNRHGVLMGIKSKEEYRQKACDFISQACEGDVIGYTTSAGKVVRFNEKTTEYGTGFPGQNLCTYMFAKCDKQTGEINAVEAKKYYERVKARDMKK